jgi:hypothetical protein
MNEPLPEKMTICVLCNSGIDGCLTIRPALPKVYSWPTSRGSREEYKIFIIEEHHHKMGYSDDVSNFHIRVSFANSGQERAPEGMELVGYDSESERYTWKDLSDDSLWVSPPKTKYGKMTPSMNTRNGSSCRDAN